MDLKRFIRDIPDFPQPGVMFRDITTLVKEPAAFKYVIDSIVNAYRNEKIDKVVSIEARGYMFAGAISYQLGCGLVPIRKPGKLPSETIALEYTLEYGTNRIEIHRDAIGKSERVMVFDDVLATGGTVLAACQLVEKLGGIVAGCAFVVNLTYLPGAQTLKNYKLVSLVEY